MAEDVIEIPVGRWFSKLRDNPWLVSTFVLAAVLVVVLISGGIGSGVSGDGIVSADVAGRNVLEFINSNPQLQGEVSLISSERQGSLYEVVLDYQGQEVPVFATLDGQFLVSDIVPMGVVDSNSGTNSMSDTPGEDDDPVLGNENAPVTIIEFSDYQCPFCHRFWSETLPLIKEEYIDTEKVKLVYRDYPLPGHSLADEAAEAAECVRAAADSDEVYFEYHDILFENQGSISVVNLKDWASVLGYDISGCLDSGEFEQEVLADIQDGGSLGTPTFFINGVRVEGAQPYSVFKQVIDSQLKQ